MVFEAGHDCNQANVSSYVSSELESSMCSLLSKCMWQQPRERSILATVLICTRFVNCEKWRKEFKVDELVRTFDYKEKPRIFEYYPQYYHKIDKVGQIRRVGVWRTFYLKVHRRAGQYTLSSLGRLTSRPCTRSRQRNECFRTLLLSTRSSPTPDCPPVLGKQEPSLKPAVPFLI